MFLYKMFLYKIFAVSLLLILLNNISGSISVKVKVHLDQVKAPSLTRFAKRLEKTVELWYPYIAGLLESPNYSPPEKVDIYLNTSLESNQAAYAFEGGVIIGNIDYYKVHPKDIGSIIHECVHVIQQYPEDSSCPQWLTEGIADYIRYYKFGHNHKKLRKPSGEKFYTNGYYVTAFFLDYITVNVRDDIIYWMNMACRNNSYDESLWFNLTGRYLFELWSDMIRNA